MERRNGLSLVNELNEISEEIESIFSKAKGKELSTVMAKRIDILETKAHTIKLAFRKSELFEAFQLYVSSLGDMETLSEKLEKVNASFLCVLEQRMEKAERDYRTAKVLLSSKEIWVDL